MTSRPWIPPAAESRPRAVAAARESARSATAFALAFVSACAAAVMFVPVLTRSHWLARLFLREHSLAVALIGAAAWLLARGRPGGVSCLARRMAVPSILAGLLPFLAPLPLFVRDGVPFSMSQYALDGLLTPAVRIEPDVALDPAWPHLTADLYHADGPGPHPFMVMAHGGSWRGGDKGEAPHFARRLAAAGFTVVDMRYRLAPAHPFPAAVADVKCLLGRLRERAAELRLDPLRAALFGRSAGGQVALVAAYSAGDPRIPPSCPVRDEGVRAVMALYSPVDLVYGYEHPMRPDVVHGNQALFVYLGGSPASAPETYRLASPLGWLDRPVPPTLLLHGEGDRIVGRMHSERLRDALAARGRAVELITVPFAEHGFEVRAGGVGEQLARHTIVRFLNVAMKG
jgi:acetyl esterase/lipase